MKNYRLVLVLKSDLKKEKKEKLLADIKKWGGDVKEETTQLGEKKFTYPIKGNLKGDYVLMELETGNLSQDLENKVRIQDDVLRHLLVRV